MYSELPIFVCYAILLTVQFQRTLQQGNGNNNGNNGNNGNGCVLNLNGNNGIGWGANNFGASTLGDFTDVQFMQPIPTWSFIYECQNSTLFLGVYNMSLHAYNNLLQPQNIYVNTVTCATTVPAGAAAGVFDVTTYNSCDNAGSCGNCGGCNCTCRVTNPWWWNCCQDPCFGCAQCCRCPTNNGWWNNAGANFGSCLQCNSDGWYSTNGQLLTPTVCQFALAAVNPNNRLDFESLVSSNFSYEVRILQRTIGCQACNAQTLANITIYVKDCNENPIFDKTIKSTSIYQYEGITGYFAGPTVNVYVRDPDIYTLPFSTVDLNVQRVDLTNVGPVNPLPFYITNPHFVGSNVNASVLSYDASRCGSAIAACLDMFRYSFSGALVPVFTVYVTAMDGGGLISTYSYSITILNTPLNPSWINLPTTISVMEGTAGPTQLFPMQAIIPGYSNTENTVKFMVIDVSPQVANGAGGPYISAVQPCFPASASSVQCAGLYLTPAVVPATLNYATNNRYNVTVWMTNQVAGSNAAFTISSSVLINILQKVYQPTLSPNSDVAYLKENVTGQACFYTINGINSQNGHTNFFFSFAVPPTHNAFYLNGKSICYDSSRQVSGPAAAPTWTFDASTTSVYTLQVTVNDLLSTMVPPTFVLTVNIVNVEDPPILNYPMIQIIPETTTTWTIPITATKEANMPALTFSLSGQNAASYNTMWYISTQTSTVASTAASASIDIVPSLAPPVFNFTVAPVIYLNVIAYTASYTVTGKITVLIQRVNYPPSFVNLANRTSIAEAITGYVTIFTVSTNDRENDPRQVYFRNPFNGQLSSYDPSGLFYIDPTLNFITTNIPPGATGFNYYTTPVYTLTVCCVDAPPLPNQPATVTSSIIVYIVLNQTAPTFTQPLPGPNVVGATIVPSIPETITGQNYIFTLHATDREGDPIYYNITDVRPTWNTAFRIPKSSSLVEYNSIYATSNPMFDYSKNPVYYIVIEASDQKTTPTSTATLTVSIGRVDKPAKWTSLPALVTVREDVYWGPTDLVVVQAIDPNGGIYPVTISYLGVQPPSGSTKLYYNTTTKNVGYNMDPQFSYGIVNSYTMLFTAFNTIMPTITGSVVVQILRVPTGPNINITNSTVYLHENITVGLTLWDMRARDNMSLTLNYKLYDINPVAFNKFYITNQGVIRSIDNPRFNYQTAPSYVIRATATNAAGLAVTFTLTVSIIDDPEPPTITNLPSFAVVKEGTVGVVFGGLYNVKCVDQDSRPLTWNYNVLPNTGFNNFNISSTGVITTTPRSIFSYADQPYYYVVAFCSNGFYTSTGTLTVVVVWSTSTTSTTPVPRTTIPDFLMLTTESPSGDLLTPGEIGAIVGSLIGALVLALTAWGIARALQRKNKKEGVTDKIKTPASTIRTTTV